LCECDNFTFLSLNAGPALLEEKGQESESITAKHSKVGKTDPTITSMFNCYMLQFLEHKKKTNNFRSSFTE